MFAYWMLFGVFAAGALLQPRHHGDSRYPSKRSALLLNLAAVMMALMIGLRFEVGGDWPTYGMTFRFASYASLGEMIGRGDPAYQALNWGVAQLGSEIWVVNLICATVFTWGLLKFAKAQADPWLAMLVAIPYLVVVVAMGYTRQAVAIGIVMAGLAAFQRRPSTLKFAIYIAAAALFHKTAVVVLPVVMLASARNRLLNVLAGAVAFALLYDVLLATSVDRFVRVYVDAAYASQGAAVRVAMSLVPAALFLMFHRRLGFSVQEAKIWRLFSFVSFGFLVLLMVLASSTAFDRLALYTLPLQLAVLARVPGGLLAPRLGTMAVIGYSAAVLFVWLNYAVHSEYWLPYQLYPWW